MSESPLLWTCVAGLNKDRREECLSHLLWEVKVHVSKSWCLKFIGCLLSFFMCACVRGHHGLSPQGMAATWRHSWSGPEGGWGKRWWCSPAAGGKNCPPPGRPHGSAARWCSCKHTVVMCRGLNGSSHVPANGTVWRMPFSPVNVLLRLLYGFNGTLKFTEVGPFFPQPTVMLAFVSCDKVCSLRLLHFICSPNTIQFQNIWHNSGKYDPSTLMNRHLFFPSYTTIIPNIIINKMQ